MSTESTTAQAPAPLNGCELVAAFPHYRSDGTLREWIVVVDRGEDAPPADRWASGWVWTLSDPQWSHGNYSRTMGEALTNALGRNGWGPEPITIH